MADLLSYGSLANPASIGQRIPEDVYESLDDQDLEDLGVAYEHPDRDYAEAVEKIRLFREMRREYETERPAGFTDRKLDKAVEIAENNIPEVDPDRAEFIAERIWEEETPETDVDVEGPYRREVGAYAAQKWMEENDVEIETVQAGLTPIYCMDASSGSMLGAQPSENPSTAAMITGLPQAARDKIEEDEKSASEDGGYYELIEVPVYRGEEEILGFAAEIDGEKTGIEEAVGQEVDRYVAVRPEGVEEADTMENFKINKDHALVTRSAGFPDPGYEKTVENGFEGLGEEFEALVTPIPGASEELDFKAAFNSLEENRRAEKGFARLMDDGFEGL